MSCSCEGCVAEQEAKAKAPKPASPYYVAPTPGTPMSAVMFPGCCGARVVSGLSFYDTVPLPQHKHVDFATSKPEQTKGIALLKAAGFRPIAHFPGQYGAYEITLWGRGEIRVEGVEDEKTKKTIT